MKDEQIDKYIIITIIIKTLNSNSKFMMHCLYQCILMKDEQIDKYIITTIIIGINNAS